MRADTSAGNFGVLLDQAAHREGAESDGLHVEGPDGALEVLAEVDEFGHHGIGRDGAQVGDECCGVLGGLVAGGGRSRHGGMIPGRAAPGKAPTNGTSMRHRARQCFTG